MARFGFSMSLAVVAFALPWPGADMSLPLAAKGDSAEARAREAYGKLPLAFEANQGQTDPQVDFLARGSGYSVFLIGGEAMISVEAGRLEAKGGALRFGLVGASSRQGIGLEALPGKVNYLRGADSRDWRTGVPTFARIVYPNVYPGVDLAYYGNHEGRLEHDFIVHPRVDPRIIELRIDGAAGVKLNTTGDIVADVAAGAVRLEKPRMYQDTPAGRIEVAGAYQRRGANRFGFEIARYDRTRPLIIDPVLVYSTYLDGSGTQSHGLAIAVDRSGAAFVAGFTSSSDFPTTPGAFDPSYDLNFDVYVAKIDPTGSALVFSTYLGGRGGEGILNGCLAIDASGAAYVTGVTTSKDFPTTAGAFDAVMDGSLAFFVTKLEATGAALAYSTFLEGTPSPRLEGSPHGIAVDAAGAAYIAGQAKSTNLPTTPGAFDISYNGSFDAFVIKLDPAGAVLVYSTYLGGNGSDNAFRVAVDASGEAIVAGNTTSADFPTTPGGFDPSANGGFDGFVSRLDPMGAMLRYSTYLGGRGSDSAFGLAMDSTGAAHVVGITDSVDFPTTAGAFDSSYNGGQFVGDAFVAKIDTTGAFLVHSTFLGGAGDDGANGVALDVAGSAYVVGWTAGSDFPISMDALQTTLGGGRDIFLSKLDSSGALVFSSYLGGSGFDVAIDVVVDRYGAAYVTGNTGSTDFPTTAGAFDTTQNGFDDPFVFKLCPGGTCAPVPCPACAAESDGRVTICHLPPGNPEHPRTLRLPLSALAGHCDHGDACGACEDSIPGSSQEPRSSWDHLCPATGSWGGPPARAPPPRGPGPGGAPPPQASPHRRDWGGWSRRVVGR